MEYERKLFIDSLQNGITVKENREFLSHVLNNPPKNAKSAKASEIARKQGNAAFLQQKKHDAQAHKAIFDHYCKSLASAPMDSDELALAYVNRSCFLLHIQKYRDCIKDVDQALKITASDVLKARLLCRKAECLKKLSSCDFSSILEIAQSYVDKTDGPDRQVLQKKINTLKTLRFSNTESLETSSNQEKGTNVLPLTNDYLNCVSIQYNKKYGRHVVAEKDYKPGDIIFIEKMYVTASNEGSNLSACDYCSKPTWSSIPCSYCNWSMYCSESCKENAWNDFHDIECSLISCIREYCTWKSVTMVIRVLITAIKETGSIARLKKELESLDQCKDATLKGFFKNDQLVLNTIRYVHSLACHYGELEKIALVPLFLICLSKHSKLKNSFDVKQLEDLCNNEDITFLGSLLIKIVAVLDCNSFLMDCDEVVQKSYVGKPTDIVHWDKRCCLSTLFSLLNHSCSPTAAYCCMEPNKLLVFALRPIRKNSQIFIGYEDFFDVVPQSKRQALFQKGNFTCDCQACIEAWPPILDDGKIAKIYVQHIIADGNFDIGEFNEVETLLTSGRLKDINEIHIKKLSALIMRGSHWKQPSLWFCLTIRSLISIFRAIYARKSMVFDECHAKYRDSFLIF